MTFGEIPDRSPLRMRARSSSVTSFSSCPDLGITSSPFSVAIAATTFFFTSGHSGLWQRYRRDATSMLLPFVVCTART